MEKTNTQSPCSVFLVHRSLSAEEIQKEDVESLIATRMERFLSTHTLKFDLKGSEVMDAVTSAGRALGDAADSLGLTEEEDDTEMAEEGRKKGERIFLYSNSELEENCIDRKCDFLQRFPLLASASRLLIFICEDFVRNFLANYLKEGVFLPSSHLTSSKVSNLETLMLYFLKILFPLAVRKWKYCNLDNGNRCSS